MDLELTTSVTNLIMGGLGIIALIITLLIKTSFISHKRVCIRTLASFTTASFLGYFNHAYIQSIPGTLILWFFLYAAMFECVRLCLVLVMDSRYGESRPTHKEKCFMMIPELILFAAALAIRPFNTIISMLFFLVYSSVISLLCLYQLIRLFNSDKVLCRIEASFLLVCFALTVPALIFQYCKKGSTPILWCFDHNGVSHLIIILSFIFLILGIITSLRVNVEDNTRVIDLVNINTPYNNATDPE